MNLLKYFTKNSFPSLLKYLLKQWQFTRILVTGLKGVFGTNSRLIMSRLGKNEDQTYARISRHHEDPIKAPFPWNYSDYQSTIIVLRDFRGVLNGSLIIPRVVSKFVVHFPCLTSRGASVMPFGLGILFWHSYTYASVYTHCTCLCIDLYMLAIYFLWSTLYVSYKLQYSNPLT